jgi:hypothetical protein
MKMRFCWSTKLILLVNKTHSADQQNSFCWSTKLILLVNKIHSVGQQNSFCWSTKLILLVNKTHSAAQFEDIKEKCMKVMFATLPMYKLCILTN